MDITLTVLGKGLKKAGELSASVYNCLMFSDGATVSGVQKKNCVLKSSIACLLAERVKKTLMKTTDLAKLIPLFRNYIKESYGSTNSLQALDLIKSSFLQVCSL